MDDPNEGLLGISTRWGTSEPAPPQNIPATRSLGRLPADAPGCLLIVDMTLRLDRIKGQNGNVDAKVQTKRASLNLGAETYNDLCERLRNVSDNQLEQHPIYYRAIVLELELQLVFDTMNRGLRFCSPSFSLGTQTKVWPTVK